MSILSADSRFVQSDLPDYLLHDDDDLGLDDEPTGFDRAWWSGQNEDGFWSEAETDRSDLRLWTVSALDHFLDSFDPAEYHAL